MPQKPATVIVEIPGVGNVEFPSSMTTTEIAQEATRLTNQSQQSSPQPAGKYESGSPVGRFLRGAASTLLPSTTPSDYIEGPLYSLRHPLDALSLIANAIKDAHGQQLDKTMTAASEGRTSEMIGHGLATLLPLIGPAAATAGETIGSGDVAGGLGQATGILAPVGARTAAAKAAPAVGRSIDSAKAGLANMADSAATQRIRDVSIPKVGPNKTRIANTMTDEIAAKAVRDPQLGAFSRGTLLDKVESRLDDARATLDAAADARNSAATFKTADLIAELRKEQSQLVAESVKASKVPQRPSAPTTTRTTMGIPGRGNQGGQPTTATLSTKGQPLGDDVIPPEFRPAYDYYERTIRQLEQLGPVARYESLRRLRAAADVGAKERYAPSVSADFMKRKGEGIAAEKSAGAMRDFLGKADPATAKANADFHLYKTYRDVLAAAEEADRSRPNRGLRTVARASGAVAGGAAGNAPGAIAGIITGDLIERIATSGVTPKIEAARILGRIADALRTQNTAKVPSLQQQLFQLMARTSVRTSVGAGRTTAATTPVPVR